MYFTHKYFSILALAHRDPLLDVSDVCDPLRACACRLCVALSANGRFFGGTFRDPGSGGSLNFT